MIGLAAIPSEKGVLMHASWPDFEKEIAMPDKAVIKRAKRDAKQGKSPSTQAGEFVREEIHHVREGARPGWR